MPNIGQVIKSHNKKIMVQPDKKVSEPNKLCNCRNELDCPLQDKCLTSCVVYRAQVKAEGKTFTYVGSTEGKFKIRFNNHKSSFNNEKQRLSSELSKKIWLLRDENKTYTIAWDIVRRARPRKPGQKTCELCNSEKLVIVNEMRKGNPCLLNKRSELVSKCRHVNKFLLEMFWKCTELIFLY